NQLPESVTSSVGAGYKSLMDSFQQRLAAGEVSVHHHHAEFQPEETDDHAGHSHRHDHSHSHSHSHSHGHSHSPYKHIGHPHGPRTMINDNVCCCFMGQFPQSVIDEEMAVKAERPGVPSCRKS
ncbi:MAG: hypothetical protein P8X74_23965, partial [Reinekea sp.]